MAKVGRFNSDRTISLRLQCVIKKHNIPQIGKQMKHKCLFLYSESEIEGTRERHSVIMIRFQGKGGGHFVISLSHMNSLYL